MSLRPRRIESATADMISSVRHRKKKTIVADVLNLDDDVVVSEAPVNPQLADSNVEPVKSRMSLRATAYRIGRMKKQSTPFWNDAALPCPFATLSAELIVVVMSHLNTADLCQFAQVCRTWRDLASESELWRKVLITPGSVVTSFSRLAQLIHKHRSQSLIIHAQVSKDFFTFDNGQPDTCFVSQLCNGSSLTELCIGDIHYGFVYEALPIMTNITSLQLWGLHTSGDGDKITRMDWNKYGNPLALRQLHLETSMDENRLIEMSSFHFRHDAFSLSNVMS